MPADLPRHVQLKLEQTLAQWHSWRDADDIPGAPHLVKKLDGGISNYNLLVEAAGLQFVIRIDGVNPASNGLNRQVEWRALQEAFKAGIAPHPRYFNPELGALVCDYLVPDRQQELQLEDLGELLRRIHQLPGLHYRMDPAERIRRYQRQLTGAEAGYSRQQALVKPIQALLRSIEQDATPLCLCHHDLTRSNLLYSGGTLFALDWEYSAMGHPAFDLATLVAELDLAPPASAKILELYLGRPPNERDWLRLRQQDCISRYLAIIWHLSQKPGLHDESVIEGMLSRLQASMDQLPTNRGSY